MSSKNNNLMDATSVEEPSSPSQNAHILFVDDEENILNSLRRLVYGQSNWTCHFADSPRMALEVIAQHRIAVIVSDHRMADMTGADFLAQLNPKRPHTVKIMLTGQANLHDVEKAINRADIYRFILKPWNDVELLEALTSAVQVYHGRLSNERLKLSIERKAKELERVRQGLEERLHLQQEQLRDALSTAKSLNMSLDSILHDLIRTVFALIESARPPLGLHCREVARLSVAVGQKLQMPSSESSELEVAALLHDIGKLGFPDYLIERDPSELRPSERTIYELHPKEGAIHLRGIPRFERICRIIESHHEYLNGRGFPAGLRGGAVPLEAYIIGVADTFVSAANRISTQPEVLVQKAYHAISQMRDELYPARVVTAMLQVIEDEQVASMKKEAFRVHLRDLAPKMRLARNLYSASGTLLAAEGTRLTTQIIARIRSIAQVDQIAGEIFAYWEEAHDA